MPAFTFVISQFSLICICSFIIAVLLEMHPRSGSLAFRGKEVRIRGDIVPFLNYLICDSWHKQNATRKKTSADSADKDEGQDSVCFRGSRPDSWAISRCFIPRRKGTDGVASSRMSP